jgi:hypothetical protein
MRAILLTAAIGAATAIAACVALVEYIEHVGGVL